MEGKPNRSVPSNLVGIPKQSILREGITMFSRVDIPCRFLSCASILTMELPRKRKTVLDNLRLLAANVSTDFVVWIQADNNKRPYASKIGTAYLESVGLTVHKVSLGSNLPTLLYVSPFGTSLESATEAVKDRSVPLYTVVGIGSSTEHNVWSYNSYQIAIDFLLDSYISEESQKPIPRQYTSREKAFLTILSEYREAANLAGNVGPYKEAYEKHARAFLRLRNRGKVPKPSRLLPTLPAPSDEVLERVRWYYANRCRIAPIAR